MGFQKIKSSRSLRLTLRFVVPLIVVMTLLAFLVVPLVDKLTLRWSVRDLDMRSKLITSTFQEPLGDLLVQGSSKKINSLISEKRISTGDAVKILDSLKKIDRVLGIMDFSVAGESPEITALIEERNTARAMKDWEKAGKGV